MNWGIYIKKKYTRYVLTFFALVLIVVSVFSLPPSDFPTKKTVVIQQNTGLNKVANILEENNIIQSAFLYKSYVILLGGSKKVLAGDYVFDEPQSVLRVAWRTIKGLQGLPRIKVTIPEGLAASDISRLFVKNIPDFDAQTFLDLAKPEEGYLFPDTYFFYENVTPGQIVDEMRANFDAQTTGLTIKATFSGHSWEDIIKMASIIEEEASDKKDRRIIAGILWKRIENNMALQVDAPFFYLFGKTSAQLTKDDLASDNPYNLYQNTGLPPTPISNPSLDSIEAALSPVKTDYWFYLSDKEGKTHYAKDHDGHVANKVRYLQ